jgi:hypothetical protein
MAEFIGRAGMMHVDDEVKERAVTAWVMAGLLGAAAVGVVVMAGGELPLRMDDPDFNPMVLLVGFLAAGAVVQLVKALRLRARHGRQGVTRLVLAGDGVGRLGQPVVGVVRTEVPLAAQVCRLRLQVLEGHSFRRAGGDFTTQTRTHHNLVWEQEIAVPLAGVNTRQGIPFSFHPPPGTGVPKPTRPRDPNGIQFTFKAAIAVPGLRRVFATTPPNSIQWVLTVTADTEGGPFVAEFPVPMQ